MSRQTMISLAVSIVVGTLSVATVSTDALAAKKSAHHRAVAAPPAAAPAVITTNGPVADRIPRCFDLPILYPYPPCY